MSEKKTVLVVGAGASREVNLPTGLELTHHIAEKTNFRRSRDRRGEAFNLGDQVLRETLSVHASELHRETGVNTAEELRLYLEAGVSISKGMPSSKSIDSFIEKRGDKRIELCGKLAIVQSILEAEGDKLRANPDKRNPLYYDHRNETEIKNPESLNETWYSKFYMLLTDGAKFDELGPRFERIALIVFNYDRCIEHYLFHTLRAEYGKSAEEVAELLETLEIYHPYGMVDLLPWQSPEQGTNFGDYKLEDDQFLMLVDKIKTFSEKIRDVEEVERMRMRVGEAGTILFLGFGFHIQNMDMIRPPISTNRKVIYATAYTMSKPNRDAIDDRIGAYLGDRQYLTIYVQPKDCVGLFEEYGEVLNFT